MALNPVDVTQLSIPGFNDRVGELRHREGTMLSILYLGIAVLAACALGGWAPAVLASAAWCGAAAISFTKTCLQRRREEKCFQAELRRRNAALREDAFSDMRPAASPACDFNPAAATVLDKDIRPMSPLRLRNRPLPL
ncbi:MAG: hypothetical protein EPN97_13705 [Alphaproteobacteria bacterium]|nr:MAG: hypothetical protein EPN97_13705 [Alphaproteobacteria bacterium]